MAPALIVYLEADGQKLRTRFSGLNKPTPGMARHVFSIKDSPVSRPTSKRLSGCKQVGLKEYWDSGINSIFKITIDFGVYM